MNSKLAMGMALAGLLLTVLLAGCFLGPGGPHGHGMGSVSPESSGESVDVGGNGAHGSHG